MAAGKMLLPYPQFLVYHKGENGLLEIVPDDAEGGRLIFRLFMEEKILSVIAKHPKRTEF